MSGPGLGQNLDAWHRLRAVVDGAIVQLQGEVNRRELFREDGAPTSRDWQVGRFGVSTATARAYDQVAGKARDLPFLTRALGTGEIGLDKMRVVAAVATPETDREFAEMARSCSVHELREELRLRRRPEAKYDRAHIRHGRCDSTIRAHRVGPAPRRGLRGHQGLHTGSRQGDPE